MGISVQNNLAAMNAQRNMGVANNKLGKAMEKLSTGFRINRAADDAAGLAISEKMRAQIKGLNRASKNAADGISLIQTAEGALASVHDMLGRMETLATQAANQTMTQDDKQMAQNEINQLLEEIDRIADTTEFNTMKLLNGDLYDGKGGLTAMSKTSGSLINASKSAFETRTGDFAPVKGTTVLNGQGTLHGLLGVTDIEIASARMSTKLVMTASAVVNSTGSVTASATYNSASVETDAAVTIKMLTVGGSAIGGVGLYSIDANRNVVNKPGVDGVGIYLNWDDNVAASAGSAKSGTWIDIGGAQSYDKLLKAVELLTTTDGAVKADEIVKLLETVMNEALNKDGHGFEVDLKLDGNGKINLSSKDGNTKLQIGTADELFTKLGLASGKQTEVSKAYSENGIELNKILSLEINGRNYKVDLKGVSNVQAGDTASNFVANLKSAVQDTIKAAMSKQNLKSGDNGFIDASRMDLIVDEKSGRASLFFAEQQLNSIFRCFCGTVWIKRRYKYNNKC